jgi:hypothetical protein
MRLMAASARDAPLVGGGDRELQELVERGRSGRMNGRTHRHLDGFQIQAVGVAPALEDNQQQLVYFARDLPADRFPRFFSCGDSESSAMGRARQIFSLTSSNC